MFVSLIIFISLKYLEKKNLNQIYLILVLLVKKQAIKFIMHYENNLY